MKRSDDVISIEEIRALILEKNGSWVPYRKKVGFMHQACLEDYANKKRLLNASIDNIIKQESCIIIRNLDNVTIVCDMPEKLSDEQLYQLELLSTFSLDGVTYMEVAKHTKNKEQQFVLDNHVAEKFSSEVLQSYYSNELPTNSKGK